MKEELLKKIFSKKNWRHRIHLENELYTPGHCAEAQWFACKLPTDVNGKTFLDIGSNDGMYSFLAEKKGASKVCGIDLYNGENDFKMTAGWDFQKPLLVKEYLNSKVDFHPMSVYDVDQLDTTFDYVYCANVLAWLKDPLEAIEKIASITKEILHFREDISFFNTRPLLELVYKNPGDCYYNANQKFFETNLKQLGFKKIEFDFISERDEYIRRKKNQWVLNVSERTPVYLNPFSGEVVDSTEKHVQMNSDYQHNDFFYLPRSGWIKKEDTVSITKFEPGTKFRLSTKINRLLKNKLLLEKNYSIKAYR